MCVDGGGVIIKKTALQKMILNFKHCLGFAKLKLSGARKS
jgi:hypothetical protein